MEYCQSTLPFAACISMNVMTYFPAVFFLISAIIINKKKSYICEMRRKQEFEENPQMILRSKLNKMVKQVVSLINFLVCLVFLVIYAQEPAVSIVVLAFYGIQASIFIASTFIIQSEFKRQGQNSLITLSNYILNFLIQAGMGVFIKLENTVDTHCFALLIILQSTSLVTSCCVILMRNDFTKEALQIQSQVIQQIKQRQNSLKNNLIDQSCNQSTFIHSQNQSNVNVNDVTASTINNQKKNQKQSLNGNSFKDFSIVDIQNASSTDLNNYKRAQSANTSSRSDAGEGRDNRFTPSFSQNSAKQSTVSNNEEEPKAYLYAYRDVKVIGYKAKDNQMLFVIGYFRGVKQYKTDRSHRDFKYLSFQLSNELARSSLTLPSLPQRIQKTGVLDKKVLKDKMTKYNRFLYYIEYNKIESKEFAQFLLPNKERPVYAPASSKTNSDIESFISSYTPPESANNSITESFKLSPKNGSPKSHSTVAFSRVSSESGSRIRNELITSQFNIEPISENLNEQNYDQEDETPSKQSVININDVLSSTQSQLDNNVSLIQETMNKEITAKDSTDSASTVSSNTVNRNKNRSQTTQVVPNKYNDEKANTESKQIDSNNSYSFMTQSEKLSVDSQKYSSEERQASALSEGQESLLIENSQNSKAFNKQSLFNSISQEDTNITASQNNKSSVFSFSQKSQIDQQAENVFFKTSTPQVVKPEYPMIIIPQTKEMNGKTFYEIEFYLNGKKIYNVDKRYNNFKEFHLTMKSELKKSNQIPLLPELPYKPSKQSSKTLIEYRKSYLAKYLSKIQQIPVIYNSPIYKKFIQQS